MSHRPAIRPVYNGGTGIINCWVPSPINRRRGANEYHLYNLDELISFVRNRNLSVPSEALVPSHSEYIKALKLADENFTFRLFDLPTEVRLMIYQNLLTIDENSTTCYPQILCAGKAIQKEASQILYKNTIKIRVYLFGVEVNGIRCGTYSPCGFPRRYILGRWTTRSIEWPEFLRRAINISVEDAGQVWYHAEVPMLVASDRSRTAAMDYVLYSLCSTLESNHCCEKLSCDYLKRLLADGTAVDIRRAHYPLRLLNMFEISLNNHNGGSGDEIDIHDDRAFQQAVALRSSILPRKVALSYKVAACLMEVLGSTSRRPWLCKILNFPHYARVNINEVLKPFGLRIGRATDASLKDMLLELRLLLAMDWVHVELQDEVKQLMLLEIELCTSREDRLGKAAKRNKKGQHNSIGFYFRGWCPSRIFRWSEASIMGDGEA